MALQSRHSAPVRYVRRDNFKFLSFFSHVSSNCGNRINFFNFKFMSSHSHFLFRPLKNIFHKIFDNVINTLYIKTKWKSCSYETKDYFCVEKKEKERKNGDKTNKQTEWKCEKLFLSILKKICFQQSGFENVKRLPFSRS